MMNPKSKILIAGAETLAGKALSELLNERGFTFLNISAEEILSTEKVKQIFEQEKPEFVFLVAGKSGGIMANQKYPATLMRENLIAQTLMIEASWTYQVKKLLFLASSCVYPKNSPQPQKIESIMTSPLEPTCQSYALAKLAGLELCKAYRKEHQAPFISVIAADAFGSGDNFDPENSHVVPALIGKMHAAKTKKQSSISLWGTGTPLRDFLFSQDLADGCFFLMTHYDNDEPVNLTANCPLSIQELASLIKQTVGYTGEIIWDTQKQDGSPSKILDAAKIQSLGWKPSVRIREALQKTYEDFLAVKKREPLYA